MEVGWLPESKKVLIKRLDGALKGELLQLFEGNLDGGSQHQEEFEEATAQVLSLAHAACCALGTTG